MTKHINFISEKQLQKSESINNKDGIIIIFKYSFNPNS